MDQIVSGPHRTPTPTTQPLLHPPNSYVKAPALSMAVFGDRTFNEIIKIKRGHRVGP